MIVKKQLRATKSVAEVTMQDTCDDLHAAKDAKTTDVLLFIQLFLVIFCGIVKVTHL